MTEFAPYVYDDIKQAAIDSVPNEACGFLVQHRHFVRVLPARNIHEEPTRFFMVAPEDYAKAANEYEKIIAVYHSHVKSDVSEPGKPLFDHDRAVAEHLKLPYLVYSVAFNRFTYYEPSGWSPGLLGRRWVPGVFDCWTLSRDYFTQTFGLEFGDYVYDEYWYRDPATRLIEENFAREGFQPIHPPAMRKHDGMLFSFGTPQVSHCAIYLGDSMFMHHRHGGLSCREPLSQAYRDHLVVAMRHKTLIQPGDERTFATEFK